MVRVLVVDDSAFMRNALSSMLSSDPEIEVIATARDGVEAVEKAAQIKPDVVTMDIEMPRMDGIEALRQIMERNPLPVIMVSSLTTEGAEATLDALDLGAVDFMPKDLSEFSVNILKIKEALVEKIKQIGKRGLLIKRRQPLRVLAMPETSKYSVERRIAIIAIGTSTGGPKALHEIIPRLPKDFSVPILIAQHMPPSFTSPFAERLNQLSQITVKEAEEGEPLKPGVVLIAPGRGHMAVKGKNPVVTISEQQNDFIYRPSADVLMLSAAENFPRRALGVILTGMGNDGEKGMRAIKKTGGRTVAQSEQTCVVYGMPRVAIEAGLADKIVPVDEIAGEIINMA